MRLCKAMWGYAWLCMSESRPYGCGLALAIFCQSSANCIVELPLLVFCVKLLWRIYGDFT